ncbi:MAG TPA: DUF1259 domain-containing protein [Chitinophagaceae bacterium]|nr:DUF1259 domain-containing protein [Chitinophagaceae bacterium]
MKKYYLVILLFIIFSCNSDESAPSSAQSHSAPHKILPELSTGTKTDFKKISYLPEGIENIFGKMPSKENGFYKFSFPRQDVNVMLEGIKVDPRFAFTTWFAFMPHDSAGSSGMLMGDVVLLESEFKNVLKKLDEKGIDVAAIHNHILGEKPKIMYLHVMSMGKPTDLFNSLKEVLSVTATPLKTNFSDTAKDMDWGKTEEVLGVSGKKEGSILKFSVPRNEKIQDAGVEIPENFGVNSVINFQRVGNKAAVTGDFVLIPSEVTTVEKMLTRGDMVVTALHSHMLFEQPRLFFMHFWAVDDPEKLAVVLHDVLRSTNHAIVRK